MNREFDREIDALLRRHTRAAAGGRVPDDDEGAALSPQSEHLDADELSAFAENAVPASARSLYVSHLADCTECRHAVAGLARTSNVSVESERQAAAGRLKTSEPSARGGWLSALFSPRVLRYAFPALALCLVGVIAFVALRSTSQRDAGQVAQHNEPEDNKGRAEITRQAPPPTTMPSGIGAAGEANQNANASIVAGGAASDQPAKSTPPAEQQAPVQGVLKDTNATGPAPTSTETFMAPPPAPPASANVQESVGVVVEAAPKAVSKEKGEEAKMSDAASRERQSDNSLTYNQSQNQAARSSQPRKVDIDQSPDGSRDAQRSESRQAAGRAANNTLPMLSRGAGDENDRGAATASRRTRPARPRDKREDEEPTAEAETRSVSNHRFRREGGVWVDVKYSNSLPTTGVRRGSDTYRALVADIPELGRIAEQFAGETVVVVVKGRAYRIR